MPPTTIQGTRAIYLLPLTDDGAPGVRGGYIYLPAPTNPPYKLRFAIEGTSSICRQGSLWVNIPNAGEPFERSKFREYKLKPDFNRTLEIDVPITCAGAFAFYTTYAPLPEFSIEPVKTPEPTKTPTHYVDVEPTLTIGGSRLPLDSLSIMSVVSKFMGQYPHDWDRHLRGIAGRGYNMVHFTPLQQRGESNSPYSIYDQLAFDSEVFPGGEEDVAKMINTMERDYDLLGLTDVVFNHTANNSKWLEHHPEAGYNIETAPWLESALELDDALLQYGEDLEKLGMPTDIKSEADLSEVVDGIIEHVINRIRLWEYFSVDVVSDTAAVIDAWTKGQTKMPDDGTLGGGLDEIKSWSLFQKADFLKNKGMLNGLRNGLRIEG